MKIRFARKEELKEITKIFISAYNIKPYNEKWTFKRALSKLKQYFKEGKILIAIEDKLITGALIYNKIIWDKGDNYQIEEFFVLPNKQKQGIGSKLFDYFETLAKKNKIRAISFMANEKSKAYKFYIKKKYKKEMIYLQKLITK